MNYIKIKAQNVFTKTCGDIISLIFHEDLGNLRYLIEDLKTYLLKEDSGKSVYKVTKDDKSEWYILIYWNHNLELLHIIKELTKRFYILEEEILGSTQ